MSEAVHQHLAKLPNPLRGLKPHQPGCDAADKLPPSTKAAVHGGAVFVTGVIVSSGLQLLARLHEFHQQHLDGGTADTTQRPRRRFGLLRGFGHRAHAHHHKEHAYVVVTDVKTHRCTPCVNTNASLSNIPRGAHGLAERAWDQQRRCNPHGAIPYLEQALASNPTNTDLLVLIAKQWSDSSFLPDCPADQRIPVNEKALSYSTKVQKLGYFLCRHQNDTQLATRRVHKRVCIATITTITIRRDAFFHHDTDPSIHRRRNLLPTAPWLTLHPA